MNYKTTYILFGILIAILLLVGLTWWFEPVYEETDRFLLPSANGKTSAVQADDVVKVKIERTQPAASSMVFQRDDADSKEWEIVQPHALRADSTKIESLIGQALRAEADPKASVPGDLKAAGLEPPAETVTLTTKDKKELKVNAGGSAAVGDVVYLNSSEKPSKPVAVLRSSVDALFQPLASFRDARLLAAAASDFTKLNLTLNKADKTKEPKGPLNLIRHKDDSLWEYKSPTGYDGSAESGESSAPLDATKPPPGVDALTRDLADLRIESGDKESDWVEDDPEDLDKYGLDPAKSDVLTVKLERALTPGGDKTAPMTLAVALGKKADDKKYYASVTDEKHGTSVAKIATTVPDAIALLFNDPTVLCSRNLAPLGALQQPLAVSVKNDAGTFQFLRLHAGDPWKLYRNDGKDEVAVDQGAAESFINTLVQKGQVRSFVEKPDEAALGLNDKSPTVKIWVDGVEEEKKPEAKDDKKDAEKKDDKPDAEKKEEPKPRLVLKADKADKPAAELTYGNVEGGLAVIKRKAEHTGWSETAVVKAPDLLETQARQGPLHYYDKTLPQFNAYPDLPDKGVTDLKLTHDGVTYVVHRDDDKPDTKWVFKEPQGWESRKVNATLVQSVLRVLDDLSANELVADLPSKDDLAKNWGINPDKPTLQAVVTKKDDKNSPYTITFGNEKDGALYAVQSQRPTVFLVDKVAIAVLSQDLRDRTVFAVDPAKVKGLKLTRLVPNAVAPDVVEFKKEGDQWTPTPAFPLDADKVTKLVQGLATLTASEIIKDDKIKAAFDKDDEKSALTIEMVVEGEAQPLQLRVVTLADKAVTAGVPVEKKGVYASSPNSPNLPGEIFPAPKGLFDGPMSGSIYFKKAQ